MNYCSDFKYDLEVGQVKEKELANIFENAKIEVKNDLAAHKTGNIFVEYESRGKKSGIAISQADYYCFCFNESFHIIKTENLKELCRKYLWSHKDVLGGDNNTSKGILLPIEDLWTHEVK
jgi:hypothetical protein